MKFFYFFIFLMLIGVVEARTQYVATINEDCETLKISLLNSSMRVDRGEYWFPDCREYEVNRWDCTCPIHVINANVADNAINKYLFQINYTYVQDVVNTGGGGGGSGGYWEHPQFYNISYVIFLNNATADPTIIIRPVNGSFRMPTTTTTTSSTTTTTTTTTTDMTTTTTTINNDAINNLINLDNQNNTIYGSIKNSTLTEWVNKRVSDMSIFTKMILLYATILTVLYVLLWMKLHDLKYKMDMLTLKDRLVQEQIEENQRYDNLFGRL